MGHHDPWLACLGNALELVALACATSHQLGWDPSVWLSFEPVPTLEPRPPPPSVYPT